MAAERDMPPLTVAERFQIENGGVKTCPRRVICIGGLTCAETAGSLHPRQRGLTEHPDRRPGRGWIQGGRPREERFRTHGVPH